MTSEAEMVAKLERQPVHNRAAIIVSAGTRDELIGLLERANRWEAIARRRLTDLDAMVGDYFDGGNGHEAMLDIQAWAKEWRSDLDARRELADPT